MRMLRKLNLNFRKIQLKKAYQRDKYLEIRVLYRMINSTLHMSQSST